MVVRARGGADAKWVKRAKLMKAFHRKHKRWPRPKDWQGGFQIGQWLYRQRQMYFKGYLRPDRLEHLHQLGYEMEEIVPEPELWMRNYADLKTFLRKSKGRWPNLNQDSSENEKRLARWAQAAFQRYRKNDLKPKQIKLLREIGFDFRKKTFSEHFDDQFERLLQFRKKNPGRWPGYNDELPKGNNLGLWCKMLRDKKELLPDERIKRLDAIGFPWKFLDFKWKDSLERVKAFIKSNKREPKSTSTNAAEKKLGLWLTVQRNLVRRGRLAGYRKKMFMKEKLNKPLSSQKKGRGVKK